MKKTNFDLDAYLYDECDERIEEEDFGLDWSEQERSLQRASTPELSIEFIGIR